MANPIGSGPKDIPVANIVISDRLRPVSASGLASLKPGPTETTICQKIGEKLPTRSRDDTQISQDDVEAIYDRFAAVCPDFKHLIPK